MKSLLRLFYALGVVLLLLSSCSTLFSAQGSKVRYVNDTFEKIRILEKEGKYTYVEYLETGVATIPVKEITDETGTVKYEIGTPLYRNAYVQDFDTQMALLKDNFPELYSLYVNGSIVLNNMYKYVDRNTGIIKVHVGYYYR